MQWNKLFSITTQTEPSPCSDWELHLSGHTFRLSFTRKGTLFSTNTNALLQSFQNMEEFSKLKLYHYYSSQESLFERQGSIRRKSTSDLLDVGMGQQEVAFLTDLARGGRTAEPIGNGGYHTEEWYVRGRGPSTEEGFQEIYVEQQPIYSEVRKPQQVTWTLKNERRYSSFLQFFTSPFWKSLNFLLLSQNQFGHNRLM